MEQAAAAPTRYRWRFHEPSSDAQAATDRLARHLGVEDLVARLLLRRGIANAEEADRFLRPSLNDLHDPSLLPGVERSAMRIDQACRSGQPIIIYGDYDVDGITASSILWHVLRLAGADVHTYTPHRLDEGYGLNSDAIRQLVADQPVAPLIVSVDCGITALEPARVARQLGVDLIITDHHAFDPNGLPESFAIVHPTLPGSQYPFEWLCGAAVAFKVAWQFAKVHCGSERLPGPFRDLLLDLLALAALGTVADVVPLVDENRTITSHGLGRIKSTRISGLNALIDAASLRHEQIDAYHVGFVLGPRINACGRMGHARDAVKLLTEAREPDAAAIADFLTKENERRRVTEREILKQAMRMVTEAGYGRDECRAIVLGSSGWHAGVVGVVASRLVDEFCRPVVLLNYEDGEARGSARSVAGISIHDALHACSPLLKSFGGHAMAAGLRLDTDNVAALREQLVAYINERLQPQDMERVLDIDAGCGLGDLRLPLLRQIEQLAPFGRDNPAPMLCLTDVCLDGPPQRVGADKTHLRLPLRQGRHRSHAIGFGLGALAEDLSAGDRIDIVFTPKTSFWRGRKQVDIHLKDVRTATASL